MTDENKKQLIKRSPTITKKYTPPYTSLRQSESERIRTSKDPSKKWQQPTYAELDTYIETQLKEQNITPAMLRKNSKLRRQVTDWKRQVYAGVKVELEEYQKQLDAIKGTDKFTFAELEAQNKKFEEAYRAGEITTQEYNLAMTQQNANILAEQKQTMKEAEWTGTWDEYVKHSEKMQSTINSALASGLVERKGTSLVISKSPNTWTKKDVKVYNSIGFNVQMPTTKFTPNQITAQNKRFKQAYEAGEISEKQYNEMLYQQNINLQATYSEYESKGLIAKDYIAGPIQPGEERKYSYKMSKNFWDYTPAEQAKIEGMFNISSEMKKQSTTIGRLVSSGAVKVVNGGVVPNKPYLELNKRQVEDMTSLGFDMPSWETISKTQALRTDNPITNIPFGVVTVTGQITKDATGLLNWLTKDADIFGLIPDTDIKFKGLSYDDFTQWVKLNPTPSEQALLVAGNVSLGIAESLALAPLFDAGISGVMSAAGKVGNFVVSKTGIAKVASYIANNEKLATAVTKIPSFTYGKATVKNIGHWLKAHPTITAVLISAPISGMQVGTAIQQLQSGREPYEVAMELGKNMGYITGGLLYTYMKFNIKQLSGTDKLKIQRHTKVGTVQTSNGQKLALEIDDDVLNSLSKDGRDIVHTQFNPKTGRMMLIGIGEAGDDVTLFSYEMNNAFWKDLKSVATKTVKGKMSFSSDQLRKTLFKWVRTEDMYRMINEYPEILTGKITQDRLISLASKYIGKEFGDLTTNQVSSAVSRLSKSTTMSQTEAAQFLFKHPEFARVIYDNIDDFVKTTGKLTEKQLMQTLLNKEEIVKKIEAGLVNTKAIEQQIDDMASEIGEITETEFNDKISKALAEARADPLGLKEKLDVADDISSASFKNQYSETYNKYHEFMQEGSQVTVAVKTAEKAVPLTDIVKTLSEASSPVQMTKLAGTMSSEVLASALSSASSYQLLSIIPNIENKQLITVLPKIKPSALPSVFTAMSSNQLSIGIASISDQELSEVLTKVGENTSQAIISKVNPNQLTKILQSSSATQIAGLMQNKNTTASLVRIMQGTTTKQIISMLQKLDVSQLTALAQSVGIKQLTGLMQSVSVSQLTALDEGQLTTLSQALSQAQLQGQHQSQKTLLLTRLSKARKRKRKKKEKEQKPVYFEVKLFYANSSQTFKIRAKTFRGATYTALQRRKETELPLELTVQRVGADVEQL